MSPTNSDQKHNSPRVLVLSGVRGDTRRYRSIHLYEQLKLAGIPVRLSHLMDPGLLGKVTTADLVFVHRSSYDANLARLFDIVKERGGLVIHDVDDLVFDPEAIQWIDSPDFQDPVRAALYKEDLLRNRQTLERCDAITASTEYLAEKMQAFGKPVWVHRNAFSLEMLSQARAACAVRSQNSTSLSEEKIVIGYASGTPTHNKDFSLAKPAIFEVMRRYPQVELQLIGPLDPGAHWGEVAGRVRHSGLVPWQRLPFLLADFDINLAPLVAANPFGQSKSEIKYMEAAMVRVPTVASPTDAFSFAIKHGENGLLANSEEAWLDALSFLIESPSERKKMGDKAFDDAMKRYHPVARTADLIGTLNEIGMCLNGKPFVSNIPEEEQLYLRTEGIKETSLEIERRPTMVDMAWYNLRHRGGRTLAGRVWVFFRRLGAPLFPYKPR